jgi:plasmid stabilization system protein ParE
MEPVENEIRPDKIDLPVLIRRAAEIEILEAFAWYEEQLGGLGFEFLHILEDAISFLRQQPQSYQTIYRDIRRVLMRKLPYAVFYIIENDKIIVLACLHQKHSHDDLLDQTPNE